MADQDTEVDVDSIIMQQYGQLISSSLYVLLKEKGGKIVLSKEDVISTSGNAVQVGVRANGDLELTCVEEEALNAYAESMMEDKQ